MKVAHREAEEIRVEIRRHRRDANEAYKKLEKDKAFTQDELHGKLDAVQHITDEYIKEVDAILKEKEEDILTV